MTETYSPHCVAVAYDVYGWAMDSYCGLPNGHEGQHEFCCGAPYRVEESK